MKYLAALILSMATVSLMGAIPGNLKPNPYTTTSSNSPVSTDQSLSIDTGSAIGIETQQLISTTNVVNGPINTLSTSITYDSGAIQAALDSAKRNGQTEVFLPTGTYSLTNALHVWTGLSLKGYGWPILVRNYHLIGDCSSGSYTGERFMVYLHGANTLQGIVINGNSTNFQVSVAGVGDCPLSPFMNTNGVVNQTQYGDVVFANGPYDYGPDGNIPYTDPDDVEGAPGRYSIYVIGNKFLNSPGASIKDQEAGARGIDTRNNAFYGYRDHAFYLRGWSNLFGVNVPIWNVNFSDNLISLPNQVVGNSAVKLANHTYNASLNNNTFYLPEDAAFEIDAGDAGFGSGPMDEIQINNNNGTARRFLMLGGDYPSPQFHVNAVGNTFSLIDYVVGGPFSTNLAFAGDISILNCKFRSLDITKPLLLLVRGDTASGVNFTIAGCEFYGAVNIDTFGWIKALNVLGSQFYNTRTPDVSDAPTLVFNPGNSSLVAGTNQWTFKGNTVYNYARMVYENSDNLSFVNGTNILNSATLRFSENTMYGNLVVNTLFGFDGTFNATNLPVNSIVLGYNQSEIGDPGVPLSVLTMPTFSTPNSKDVLGALGLMNPATFAATNSEIGASLDFYRRETAEARIAGGNERPDTSDYGYLSLQTRTLASGMTERLRVTSNGLLQSKPTGAQLSWYGFDPEGSVAAPIGSINFRTDSTLESPMAVKTTGTNTTGWSSVPVAAGTNAWTLISVVEGASTNVTISFNGKTYTFTAW